MAYGYKDIDYFKLKIHQHCRLLIQGWVVILHNKYERILKRILYIDNYHLLSKIAIKYLIKKENILNGFL